MIRMRRAPTLFVLLPVVVGLLLTGCADYEGGADRDTAKAKPTIENKVDQKLRELLPADVKRRGTVSIAINPDVPPVKFLDDDNKVQGLIVDLLEGAAARLGLEVKWERTAFEALIPGLESKRYDIIASAGDFKERQTKVDFIDYVVTGVSLLVVKGNPKDIHGPKDLCGTRVAYVRGTSQETLLNEQVAACEKAGKKPPEGSAYRDSGGAELALRSGQADADWTDSPDAAYRVEHHPDKYEVAHTVYTGPYGIGFPKERTNLTKAFRQSLLTMSDDGSYQAIMKHYGMGGKNAMPEFPLNKGIHKGQDWPG